MRPKHKYQGRQRFDFDLQIILGQFFTLLFLRLEFFF